jgi:hypothetical protein
MRHGTEKLHIDIGGTEDADLRILTKSLLHRDQIRWMRFVIVVKEYNDIAGRFRNASNPCK